MIKNEEDRTIALTVGTGSRLAAAAAVMMASDPWGHAVLSRGYDFGFAHEPRILGRRNASGGNKKLCAVGEERRAKRKAQRKARAQTRKHRKHR